MKKNNYVKLLFIILVTVFLTCLISNLYKNYDKNKSSSSVLSKIVSTINYKELTNSLVDGSDTSIIYISYTGNKDVYNSEKTLKKIVSKNHLEDMFLFVDATSNFENKNFYEQLNNNFDSNKQIKKLPAIVFKKSNIVVDVIDSSEHLLNGSDLQILLEKNEVLINEN